MEQARNEFGTYMNDARDLLVFSQSVRKALVETPVDQWKMLSDLMYAPFSNNNGSIDLGKVARALEMRPLDLNHLVCGGKDPLHLSAGALARIWSTLGISLSEFRRLVMADSDRFIGVLVGSFGKRPTREEIWKEAEKACAGLALDDPSAA